MNKTSLGNIDGKEISYSNPFIYIKNEDEEYKSYYPLEFVNKSKIADFDYVLLQRSHSIENNSKQVFIIDDEGKKTRLGWIIPISALTSLEHDFSENEHFLNYAKCALSFLLIDIISNKSPEAFDIDINHFFQENVHIFCYYKPNFKNIEIKELTFSLFSDGYFNFSDQQSKLLIDYPESKEIYVTKSSIHISGIEYIHSLANNFLPFNDIPVFDFYYMYQIIEVIINQILLYRKDDVIMDMIDCDSASQIRESLYTINDILSEKNRIRILLNDHIQLRKITFKEDLIQNINDFLHNNRDLKQCTTLEDAIYKLRNLIIHNHYKVENFDGLEQINNLFRELLKIIIAEVKFAS